MDNWNPPLELRTRPTSAPRFLGSPRFVLDLRLPRSAEPGAPGEAGGRRRAGAHLPPARGSGTGSGSRLDRFVGCCGGQNRFGIYIFGLWGHWVKTYGIPFWLVGEFTTHFSVWLGLGCSPGANRAFDPWPIEEEVWGARRQGRSKTKSLSSWGNTPFFFVGGGGL